MIPDEFIDSLLERVDIVELIEQYVPLKKSGANYMACCPFHKEKTPSFSVSPSKQFYHCFSCGAHGSSLNFMIEHQGFNFVEAVKFLADRVGMPVPNQPQTDTRAYQEHKKHRQTLENTMSEVAKFYEQRLMQSPKALAYLKQRGLDNNIIRRYGLGFAPESWQALAELVKSYPGEFLVEGGLVMEKESRHYDSFRNRIMFPIRNRTGQVIAFGGRVLDNSLPKYVNSTNTPLFEKGKHLYGLYEARGDIREAKRVLVVEGYMDVVALAQFGIGYAVAALGTATTGNHIRLLMQQSDDIYFCFDGDKAGRNAASRAADNALPELKEGKNIYFAFLPDQHDPDSYIRSHGRQAFEELLLHGSIRFSEYFWQSLSENIDLTREEGKAALIRQAAPKLAKIKSPVLSYLFKQHLGKWLDIKESVLDQLLGGVNGVKNFEPNQAISRNQAASGESLRRNITLPAEDLTGRLLGRLSLEKNLILALLINPNWAPYVDLPEYLYLSDDSACLAALARRILSLETMPTSEKLLELMQGSEYESLLSEVLKSRSPYNANIDSTPESCRNFQEGIQKIRQNLIMQRIRSLQEESVGRALSEAENRLLLNLLSQRRLG